MSTAPYTPPRTALSAASTPSCRRAASFAVAALTTGVAMALASFSLYPPAQSGHGESGLVAWLLLGGSMAGSIVCAYLTLIWALAALALRSTRANLPRTITIRALRILAPSLARRVALTAALASTAGGLLLAPASAVTLPDPEPAGHARHAMATAMQMGVPAHGAQPAAPADPSDGGGGAHDTAAPAESRTPSPTPSPVSRSAPTVPAPEAETGPEDPAHPMPSHSPSLPHPSAPPLPPLGWGTPKMHPDENASELAEGSTVAVPSPGRDQPRVTVTVSPGDSLWSITDDLLGASAGTRHDIATSWPLLYDENIDVIGEDPGHLVPGQVLTVPSAFTDQEQP